MNATQMCQPKWARQVRWTSWIEADLKQVDWLATFQKEHLPVEHAKTSHEKKCALTLTRDHLSYYSKKGIFTWNEIKQLKSK